MGRYRSDALAHRYCVNSSGCISHTNDKQAFSTRAIASGPGSNPHRAYAQRTITSSTAVGASVFFCADFFDSDEPTSSSRASRCSETSGNTVAAPGSASEAYAYATLARLCVLNERIFATAASSNSAWNAAPGTCSNLANAHNALLRSWGLYERRFRFATMADSVNASHESLEAGVGGFARFVEPSV